jgi:hypothetical protein
MRQRAKDGTQAETKSRGPRFALPGRQRPGYLPPASSLPSRASSPLLERAVGGHAAARMVAARPSSILALSLSLLPVVALPGGATDYSGG